MTSIEKKKKKPSTKLCLGFICLNFKLLGISIPCFNVIVINIDTLKSLPLILTLHLYSFHIAD